MKAADGELSLTDPTMATLPKPGEPGYFDVEVIICPEKDIDEVVASPHSGDRVVSLFVRLVRLAREDERLRELLSSYIIRVKHGDKVLWPEETTT